MLRQKLFYPLYIAVVAAVIFITVPRHQLKRYVQYALLTGGLSTFVIVAILQKVFGVIHYQNTWIFNIFGMHALAPVGWAVTHVFFLYFLPRRKLLLYPYIGLFAMLSVTFGVIARNVGVFTYNPFFFYAIDPLVFFALWAGTAWFFLKTSPDEPE